jgi:chromosome transmission fidelity protein 8
MEFSTLASFCQARTNSYNIMIIPITVRTTGNTAGLPPQLARLGNDEVVLIELQGSLAVETNQIEDKDGQPVGKLHIDEARPNLALISIAFCPS